MTNRMRFLLSLLLVLFVFSTEAQQLVLPGDHPDPSVVKIGNEYWAVGTTSNWFPAFPVFRSTDLVTWKPAAHVFTKMPLWADYYMWAPEITYDNGKVYLYYTGHKKGGSLCIAAAVAEKPEGPYTDLGPLICQAAGSIDAFPMRDEHGKLYMIWKEDGNSIGKPTPIWAAEMKEDRTALTGTPKELFRADAAWERGLVEGVSMIKHNEYFYAFYAAAACCGRSCSYGTGVARSKNLLGPWEKFPGNPVLSGGMDWKCPGHGTPVEKNGKFYFLYHAYSTSAGKYSGRQGLLNEFEFTPDGWLRFLNGKNDDRLTTKNLPDGRLNDSWYWSIFQNVQYTVSQDTLQLNALPAPCGAYLGRSVFTDNYNAAVTVLKRSSSNAGLALIGDDNNMVYAAIDNDHIRLVQLKKGQPELISRKTIDMPSHLVLKVKVENNTQATFLYSSDGVRFEILNDKAVDISYLPPWDRAIRVGLISKGTAGQQAFFTRFILAG